MIVKIFEDKNNIKPKREKRIFLEGRPNLVTESSVLIKKIAEAFLNIDKNVKVVVDLRKSKFVYPSTFFFLIALKETVERKGIIFEVDVAQGGNVHEYLDYSGLCEEFDIEKFPPEEDKNLENVHDVYRLQTGKEIPDCNVEAEKIVDFLKERQEMLPQLEKEIIESIDEIFRNINQHSGCEKYYLLGQNYPTSKGVRFVVYDDGIGIKKHMTRKSYDEMNINFQKNVSKQDFAIIEQEPANKAIFQAAQHGVSATEYEENSGAGINYLIKDLSSISKGKILIISGDGIVLWKEGVPEPFLNAPLPFEIIGTLIALDLDCSLD